MQPLKRVQLSGKQLASALAKGQGRVYWSINPETHELYRSQLLHACTQNVAYDPHSEEDRAPWLFKLLEKTGAPESYKDEIIEALYQAEAYHDWIQLWRLVAEFAKSSDDDSEAFYAFCDNITRSISGKQIGYLRGLLLGLAQQNGADNLAELIIETLQTSPKHKPNSEFWKVIKNSVAIEGIVDPLLMWEAASPNMWQHESCYTESLDEVAQIVVEYPVAKNSTLDELFAIAESELGNHPLPYVVWARERASEQDLHAVFQRLLEEALPELQMRYLWVFQEQPLPQTHSKIRYLAVSGSLDIQAAAFDALSNKQDDRIRDFIFKLLQHTPKSLYNGALRIFLKNYKSNDAAYIEQMLSTLEDVDQCHTLCLDILELGQKLGEYPELSKLLVWAYENTPSSTTRFDILRLLIEGEAAPLALLEEAVHDCDSMTSMFETDFRGRMFRLSPALVNTFYELGLDWLLSGSGITPHCQILDMMANF